jgi:dolichol kinase
VNRRTAWIMSATATIAIVASAAILAHHPTVTTAAIAVLVWAASIAAIIGTRHHTPVRTTGRN